MQQLTGLMQNTPSPDARFGAGLGVRERLRGLVAGILTAKSAPAVFGDDDTLAEIGIASIDMVSLLLAIESDFDLEVPAQEITTEVFRSVATIDALILRMLPHLAAA